MFCVVMILFVPLIQTNYAAESKSTNLTHWKSIYGDLQYKQIPYTSSYWVEMIDRQIANVFKFCKAGIDNDTVWISSLDFTIIIHLSSDHLLTNQNRILEKIMGKWVDKIYKDSFFNNQTLVKGWRLKEEKNIIYLKLSTGDWMKRINGEYLERYKLIFVTPDDDIYLHSIHDITRPYLVLKTEHVYSSRTINLQAYNDAKPGHFIDYFKGN